MVPCNGQVILERRYFSEKDAKPIFRQLASAINHLHRLRKNVLLQGRNEIYIFYIYICMHALGKCVGYLD